MTSTEPFQLLDPLTDTEYAELRASIEQYGIQVPIVRDDYGRIIDGHHRAKIGAELGIDVPSVTITALTDDELNGLAFDLNTARRHLTGAQRDELVKSLREQGMSLRQIATAAGVSKSTVANTVGKLKDEGELVEPEKVSGSDGREHAPTKPAAKPKPAPMRTADPADGGPLPEVDADQYAPNAEPIPVELSADEEAAVSKIWLAIGQSGPRLKIQPFTNENAAQQQADRYKRDGYLTMVAVKPLRTTPTGEAE